MIQFLGLGQIVFVIAIFTVMSNSRDLFAQEGSQTMDAAARKAFDQGEIELNKGNPAGAITLLKTAVRIKPANGLYHHRLGKAFLAAEKQGEMWIHLRKAANLEHGNDEFAGDFMRMWQYFDQKGAFNCGKPAEVVLKALGEPDVRVENDQMKRWVYGFNAVDFAQNQVFRIVDLRGFTSEAALEIENVHVKTDPKQWQVAHHTLSRRHDNLELTRNGEPIQQWKELFSKQRFPMMSSTDATVKGMADSMHESLKRTYPNIHFVILSETPTSIVYHWRTTPTKSRPAEHEVAKIIKGKKDFYRVAYVKKTEKLADAEFKKWSKVIGDAKLTPRTMNSNVNASQSSTSGFTNIKLSSWELGRNLSFAALLRGRHGSDELVKQTLLQVSEHAQTLGINVPAPKALTENAADDTTAAISFLLQDAGKPIYNSLQEKYGDASSALFELATKSTLLSLLYQPGDSTSESLSSAIQRSASKANLDPAIWQPLVEMISAKASIDEVRDSIKTFQDQVSTFVKPGSAKTAETKPVSTKTNKAGTMSQVIELNGSKVAEITTDGEVWIGGNKVGSITVEGEIWVNGVKEGDLTNDGEVWKAGDKIGDITSKGEVWRDGNEVGTIEKDGTIWIGSSHEGKFVGGDPSHAATILFYGFFQFND